VASISRLAELAARSVRSPEPRGSGEHMALLRVRPPNFLHATPRRSRLIARAFDAPAFQHFSEATDQVVTTRTTSHNSVSAVGWWMSVCTTVVSKRSSLFGYGSLMWNSANDHVERRAAVVYGWRRGPCILDRVVKGSRVRPALMCTLKPGGEKMTVLHSKFDRRPHHKLIDRLERRGRQPMKAAMGRIVSSHRQIIKVGELAQRATIGNPLAQFAVVPVLDAHEN
jgi:ChaC-like protein